MFERKKNFEDVVVNPRTLENPAYGTVENRSAVGRVRGVVIFTSDYYNCIHS